MKQFRVIDHLVKMPEKLSMAMFDVYDSKFSSVSKEHRALLSKFSTINNKTKIAQIAELSFDIDGFDYFNIYLSFTADKIATNLKCIDDCEINFSIDKSIPTFFYRSLRNSIFDKKYRHFKNNEIVQKRRFNDFLYISDRGNNRRVNTLLDSNLTEIGDGRSLFEFSSYAYVGDSIHYVIDISSIEKDMYLSFDGFYEFLLKDEYFLKAYAFNAERRFGVNRFKDDINDLERLTVEKQERFFRESFTSYALYLAIASFDKQFTFEELIKSTVNILPSFEHNVKYYYPYNKNETKNYVDMMFRLFEDYATQNVDIEKMFDITKDGNVIKFFPSLEFTIAIQKLVNIVYKIDFSTKKKFFNVKLKNSFNPIWISE